MHQAALLRALVDADAFEMSLEQMQQLDELEAADSEMAAPVKKDNMNNAWAAIKGSQQFLSTESLDPSSPRREGYTR